MMYRKLSLLLALFCGWVLAAKAQNYEGIPEDKKSLVDEKFVLLGDNVSMKNYPDAQPHLNWLLANAPKFSKNIYINGIKIYKALAEKEADAAKKGVYQDSVLVLHDLQIQHFGDEAKVMNAKAFTAYYYLYNFPERYGELYEMLRKAYILNKGEVIPQNLGFLFIVMSLMKGEEYYAKYQPDFADDKVTTLYEEVSQIINTKVAASEAGWEDARNTVDQYYGAMVTITCTYIKKYLEPKYRANPDDAELIEKIIGYMIKATQDTSNNEKCIVGDPLFLELSEKLFQKEPTYKRALFLMRAYKDTGRETEFRNKALELAENGSQKADIYLMIADEYRISGQYGSAREYFFKVAQLDPSRASLAYTIVGDMYLSSGSGCKGDNPVVSRSYAIAAYNMYQKAGNGGKMAMAQRYFPDREAIFTYSMGGKSVTVPCWIGETVVIPNL